VFRRLLERLSRYGSDTRITIDGDRVTVQGRHERRYATIVNALRSFLPSEGMITITGKRIRVHGRIAEREQQIRNVLNIDLRL